MKTLFDRVCSGRRAEIERELITAHKDLEFWQRESECSEIEFAGVVMIDPRVKWNLDFHRRRVRALERAQKDLATMEARAS